MALADFTALSNDERLYLRSEGGPSETSSVVDGWPDSSGNSDATMANSATPAYVSDPGDGNGPVSRHTADNGFVYGYTTGATWTWFGAFDLTSVSGFHNVISDTGGSGTFDLYANGTTWTIDEAAGSATFGSAAATGTIYRMIVVRTASAVRVWINGVEQTLSSSITPTGTPSLVTAAYGGSGAPWDGDWYCHGVFSSDLSGSISALDAAIQEEIDGAVIELTAETGSFTETGVAAGLIADRAIAADTGSFALTGIAATLSPSGASLTAETGSFTETGIAAAFSVARNLVAETGTFTHTGVDAGLTTDATLAADTGSFTHTGQDATLTAGVMLAAETGAFTHTGVAATPVRSTLADAFDGSGALDNFQTIGAADLPDVSEAAGRYLAEVDDNTGNVTTFLDGDTGRFDYRWIAFPFDFTYRNIGVGVSAAATQTAPTYTTEDPYLFAGGHVNADPDNPTDLSQHFVVGLRGSTSFAGQGRTIEGKTTASASSSINSLNSNATDVLTGTRADIRIKGNADNSIQYFWSEPGAESWSEHTMPGSAPSWPDVVAVGIITYAFGTDLVPFVGTADGIEETPTPTLTAETGAFVETGQNATLAAALTMAAETAAFAHTGQNAGLSSGFNLAADTGSFAETGVDASLIAARSLTAEVGSVAHTGVAASLINARHLGADVGDFVHTGQDVTFSAGVALTADTGAFTETGQDAALQRGALLTAASGSFAWSGIAAALTASDLAAIASVTVSVSEPFTATAVASDPFTATAVVGEPFTATVAVT